MRKRVSIILSLVLFFFCVSSAVVFGEETYEGKRTQTIYSVLGWDGKIKNTSVVNWLRFNEGNSKVQDNPELENIVVLHPTAKKVIDGDKLYWEIPQDSSSDLFYSGTTNKKLPIEFDIALELDGKQVDESEIIGKSGKLEISIKFTNTLPHEELIKWTAGSSAKESLETVYTPVTVIVQADIASDRYEELSFNDAFEMTIGNSRKLMWTVMPRPTDTVSFWIKDDHLRLPNISISMMPSLPSIQIPEIDESLLEVMGSMGDTDELLAMLESSSSLDMSESLDNIENLENMFSAIEDLTEDTSSSMDQVAELFSNYGDSFKQIAEGADGLVQLSEAHKMILEMIQDQLSANLAGIKASTEAITKASQATDKVASSLFGIQYYLEEMETSLKDLRKITKDDAQLEIILELDTSVSKSLSKLNTVKSSADTATELMKNLTSGGTIDGVEIPALSEMPEMMDVFDQTLSALISGGEVEGQDLPGLTTTIDGLEGISEGINLILNGGTIEGFEVPAWNTIPDQIADSMDVMNVFTEGGEINGVKIPSKNETLEMIESFKKTIEEAQPMQEKMEEFSKTLKDAIEKAGGSQKFSEVMDDTEEMFHIETAKLDKMREYEKEYTSFVGNTPGFESSVLFVVKLEDVDESIADSDSAEGVIPSENDPNPYQELNKARLYLLIIGGIIILAAIVINWYYKRRYK